MRLAALSAAFAILFASPAFPQWTQGRTGGVWAKTAAYVQQTDMRFDVIGQKVPWFADGRADARALFTDILVGVHPKVDVWVQVPFFDIRFRDLVDTLRTTGFGDVKAWARWNVVTLGGRTPISLRIGAKAPVGSSPLDARGIPVGEGQWDVEGWGEVGHSFWPVPAYAELWLGYRARFENSVKRKDPGGEFTFLAEAGVNPTSGTLLKATFDGLLGRRFVVEGVRTGSSRRIITIQFGGGARLAGPLWSEFGVRLPLSGKDFPAGPQWVLGFSGKLR